MPEADAGAKEAASGASSRPTAVDSAAKPQGQFVLSDLSHEYLDVVGTAHRLNNMLVTICGLTQLLTESADDPALKEDLSEVLDQSRAASRLVTDLLDAYRRRGRLVEPVDVNSALEEAMSDLSAALNADGVSLERNLVDSLPLVSAVPRQLQQVFVNILENAGNALRKVDPPREIFIKTWSEGPWVHIEVRDQGPGIDPEILPFVFEPFFTTCEREGGTGLGLAVSRGIVRSMGGEITISSRKGHGTTVSLRLPVDRRGNVKDSMAHRLQSRRYSLRRTYGNRAARRARCTVWR